MFKNIIEWCKNINYYGMEFGWLLIRIEDKLEKMPILNYNNYTYFNN